MAQIDVTPEPSFSDWFRAIAGHAGMTSSQVHIRMVRHGFSGREETVRRWISGDVQGAPINELRPMIRALEEALPSFDVRGSFDAWLDGRPFSKAPRRKRSKPRFSLAPRDVGEMQGTESTSRLIGGHLELVKT